MLRTQQVSAAAAAAVYFRMRPKLHTGERGGGGVLASSLFDKTETSLYIETEEDNEAPSSSNRLVLHQAIAAGRVHANDKTSSV